MPLGPWTMGLACGYRLNCDIKVEKTQVGDPGSPCDQLDQVACTDLGGTMLKITGADCSKKCVCAHRDGSTGLPVYEEM